MENLEDLLKWDDGTLEYENRLVKTVSKYASIIIFGAGIGGRITVDLLKKNNLSQKVKAFCDNNKDKVGTVYYGLPVIGADLINDYIDNTVILISSTAFDIISKQLVELGIDKEDIYFFQPAGLSIDDRADTQFIKEHIIEFNKVYNLLKDETSKFIFRCLLNYRISKDEVWLKKMQSVISDEKDQYFDKEILKNYSFEEAFVDAGGYDGDTVDSFYKHYPQWGGTYYCVEAVKDIYARLCKHLNDVHKDRKIIALNYAVWQEDGKLYFDTAVFEEGSRISDKGIEVKCASLDNLFSDKKISFIKMDIEGAERNALLGARKIIEKNVPILAICIYHRPEDFYDIPLLIQSMKKDEYEFYVRQYRYGQSETVLYAMPQSRRIS